MVRTHINREKRPKNEMIINSVRLKKTENLSLDITNTRYTAYTYTTLTTTRNSYNNPHHTNDKYTTTMGGIDRRDRDDIDSVTG